MFYLCKYSMILSQYSIFKATLCCFLVSLYMVCTINNHVRLDIRLNNETYITLVVKLLVLPLSATEYSDTGCFANLCFTDYPFIY